MIVGTRSPYEKSSLSLSSLSHLSHSSSYSGKRETRSLAPPLPPPIGRAAAAFLSLSLARSFAERRRDKSPRSRRYREREKERGKFLPRSLAARRGICKPNNKYAAAVAAYARVPPSRSPASAPIGRSGREGAVAFASSLSHSARLPRAALACCASA